MLAGNPVNEDIVGILDVDMCLLEDFTHFGVGVEEGVFVLACSVAAMFSVPLVVQNSGGGGGGGGEIVKARFMYSCKLVLLLTRKLLDAFRSMFFVVAAFVRPSSVRTK